MSIICNGTFGYTKDGREVQSFTLRNEAGMEVDILDYGCVIRAIRVPDKNGKVEDVVLGYDTVAGYEENAGYLGAAIGRFGNRIGKGKFTVEGKEYTLAINNGENALHGGLKGFNQKVWASEVLDDALILNTTACHMEEGYPGNMSIEITYTLTEDNTLTIDYQAESDRTTVINLTNHSYFNLGGDPDFTVEKEYIQINADYITETDAGSIPYGNLMPVEGTPFDLRSMKKIADGINADHQQIVWAGGYDHNFVLGYDKVMKLAAVVEDRESGRRMEVFTDQPGVQFYSANFLEGAEGKAGKKNNYRAGLCLETQNFPDAPNHPNFPSCFLRPGDLYHYTTGYKFSTL